MSSNEWIEKAYYLCARIAQGTGCNLAISYYTKRIWGYCDKPDE